METEAATVALGAGAGTGYPLLSTGPLWLLLILLVGLGLWWWRRRSTLVGQPGNAVQVSILATRPLGPRAHLIVVEAAGHRSLIATTAQSVHFLRDLPSTPSAASPVTPSFADHLEPRSESPS